MLDSNYTQVSEAKGPEFLLYWDKVRLWGFQRTVEEEVIKSMRKFIQSGGLFPPVPVTTLTGHIYLMAFLIDDEQGKPDGGHHRAYSHYIEKKPLLCRLVDQNYTAYNSTVDVKDIVFKL